MARPCSCQVDKVNLCFLTCLAELFSGVLAVTLLNNASAAAPAIAPARSVAPFSLFMLPSPCSDACDGE